MSGADPQLAKYQRLIKTSETRGTQMTQNKRGFTLVEMLVVVGMVALLAALSVPAYSKYVERSRRIEGQVLANRVAQAQERHFATYNRYGVSLLGNGFGNLGFVATCPGGFVGSENCQYSARLAPAVAPFQNFTVIVTPIPGRPQANDKCASLSLTATGVKAFTGVQTNGKCW